jgi:hypothetical protein
METAGLLINTGIEKELICSTRVSIARAKGKSPQLAPAKMKASDRRCKKNQMRRLVLS